MTDDEIESEECKEVFACYGAAMHAAQTLEYGIVNAMVVVRMPKRNRYSRQDIDDLMDDRFKKTLGSLIRLLHSDFQCPDDLGDILTAALERRNFLAHKFFRERNDDFMSSKGRFSMVQELQAASDIFHRADTYLAAVMKPIREQFGVTDTAIDALIKEAELAGGLSNLIDTPP